MRFDVGAHTIVLTLAGSRAHGTAGPGADIDVRGVCVAPLRMRLSLFDRFEQDEGPIEGGLRDAIATRLLALDAAASAPKTESVIFDVAKFIGLCAAANPNALEILFADPRDWLHATPTWDRLHRERHRFLTQKVQQTYLGYAMAQLKKIQTHRAWLLHPPACKPTREAFGLPDTTTISRDDQNRIEQSVAAKIRSYGIDDIEMPKAARIELQARLQQLLSEALATGAELEPRLRAVASHALRLPVGTVATLNAEKRYRAAMKHWDAYRAWQSQRNPARAELERRFGYDTKHAMHLIRLMRTGLEVLRTGDLAVRRPDADELVAIRQGMWSFDELLAAADDLRAHMQDAARTSTLPTDVDREWVDALATDIMLGARA